MNKRFLASVSILLLTAPVLAGPPKPSVKVINDESEPVPVVVQNKTTIIEYRYIGLTEFESNGRVAFGGLVGVAAMNKVCQAEFGLSARAASIAEAFWRDDPQDLRKGWLVPRGPISVLGGSLPSYFGAVDAGSGLLVSSEAYSDAVSAGLFSYCATYSQGNEVGQQTAFGVASGGNGFIGSSLCENVQAVACSAPVAIPVIP